MEGPSDLDCPNSDETAGTCLAATILMVCLGSCANMSIKNQEPVKDSTPQIQKCCSHHDAILRGLKNQKYMTLVR